jgi:hypothetical protein
VRASGPQYDDDLNLFPLGRATIVDLLVGRNVGRGLGLPRTLRAGIRIQASSRP